MPPSYQDSMDEMEMISGIVIGNSSIIQSISFLLDGMEVGNGGVFLMHCLAGIVFHVIGVIVGLILAHTHAGRYGSLSAMGILMLLVSFTVEENTRIDVKMRPLLSVLFFVGGYVLFMGSLFMFQRIQDRAKDAHRLSYSLGDP